jgi:hypothetical protein
MSRAQERFEAGVREAEATFAPETLRERVLDVLEDAFDTIEHFYMAYPNRPARGGSKWDADDKATFEKLARIWTEVHEAKEV